MQAVSPQALLERCLEKNPQNLDNVILNKSEAAF